MITRLYIDNYRCFTNFELKPGRICLLLGPNGGGKSSIFDALAAVVDLTCHGASAQDVFGPRTVTRWDRRSRQRIELDVDGNGGSYRYELVIEHPTDGPAVIVGERVTKDGRTLFALDEAGVHLHDNQGVEGAAFAYRGFRSFLPQIEDRPATQDLVWFLTFIQGTWILRLDARAMASASEGEESILGRRGENFASWYRHLSQEMPDRLPDLWAALAPIVPGFKALKLVSSGGKGRIRELVATMTTAGATYEVDFDELSDGQRALIVLYTLLYGRTPGEGCLVLDEPETHVGLSEVQPWLVSLDERFEDAGQVLVVSHHPEVVDYLAASEAWWIDRPDGGPTRAGWARFRSEDGESASKQVARGLLDDE